MSKRDPGSTWISFTLLFIHDEVQVGHLECGRSGRGPVKHRGLETIDVVTERGVLVPSAVDRPNRMHDRGVISATEVTTDLLKAEPGVPSGQPHADLTRHGD